MGRVPVEFKRVAAVFGKGARINRPCDESSGSEHSGADLSDLVNSFLEREVGGERGTELEDFHDQEGDGDEESEIQCSSPDIELKDSLKKLLGCDDDDRVKRGIRTDVEKAYRELGKYGNSSDLRRRLMARLRDIGLNAGVCKTKWEKNGGCPSGDYEYIDVNVGSNDRYIIEVSLAEEFKIARPTDFYTSLLQNFPPIYVGKVDELKQIVRLVCRAMKKSMKRVEIHVPPWRRLAYLQAKWFGSYKRTTNEIPTRTASTTGEDSNKRRSVGFTPVPVPRISFNCREDFARRGGTGARLGNLAAAFKDGGMLKFGA